MSSNDIENNVIEMKTEKEQMMKTKNEVNTTLSKFTEEELHQLKLLFVMSALFPYPPNWDLEMKCKESVNERKNTLNSMFSVDLTEEEVISIIKEYRVTKEEAISIQKETMMKNGHEIGYYENGQKQEENYFNKEGYFHGRHIRWYENGQKEEEGNYVDGKEDGLFTGWYENGEKEWEGNFKDGKQLWVNKF